MTTVDELAQIIRQVDGNHSLGAGALAEAIIAKLPHIAARQPVADWSKRGSQPTDWRNELLTLADHHEPITAFARSAMRVIARSMPAPAAKAVDLGAMPDGWRLRKKATCYQLSHGNDIVGNLVGPDAEDNAAIIARVLDSKAVGK